MSATTISPGIRADILTFGPDRADGPWSGDIEDE